MLAQEFPTMTIATFAVAALLAAPAPAQTTTISGDWEMTIQSMQGTNSVRVTFKQEGEKVSGIFKSPMGELPFQDGTLVGDDLKFAFSLPIQGQPLEITMTGKVDGSSIAGKAQFGGFGEGEWTAKRIEEAPAAAAASSAVAPSAPAAAATGISGRWDVTVKTQIGDIPVSADLVETSGKISGSLVGPAGPVDVSGTFDGNAIKLSFVAKTPQGDIPIEMSGELDGDTIVNGKAEFGGMGQGEWTARRKQ
jgi:hypothetical protein